MTKPTGGPVPDDRGQENRKPKTPAEGLSVCQSFYSGLGFGVGRFAAVWHIIKVAQLLETDLNRVSGLQGLSIADYHMLSALMIADPEPMTATDLVHALNVSNAVLSVRSRKMAEKGFLTRSPSETDRRTVLLQLTAAGKEKVMAISRLFDAEGSFARHFLSLPETEREALQTIMPKLHAMPDREFLPSRRADFLRA